MLPPNLHKWTLTPETENILFFAQLIEELLFNFSLEHFKVPMHNSHTLVVEMLEMITHCEAGHLNRESLLPITDELTLIMARDPVLETLPTAQKDAIGHGLKADSPLADMTASIRLLNDFLKNDYLKKTIVLLREKIIAGEKEPIASLTRNFLTEMIHMGYSPESIFFENKNHFFEGPVPDKIQDLTAFDTFFELFPLNMKKWTVVFRTGKDFKHIQQFPPSLQVSASTEKPDMRFPQKLENIGIFLDKKFKLPNYLTFNEVAAFDGFSARAAMEEKLVLLDCLAKYYIHRAEVDWSRAALVFDEKRTSVGVFGKPAAAIFKRPDQRPRRFSAFINDAAAAIFTDKLDEDSSIRLLRALQIHDMALRAPTPENQLRELWSAMELLFAPNGKGTNNITQFSTRLTPYLTMGFPAKLAADLIKSIRNGNSKEALEILYSIEHGNNLIEKCLLLVFTAENCRNRETLQSSLGSHCLLRQRIDYLARIFVSAESIHATLEAYAREISWQIQRIHRTVSLFDRSRRSVSVFNKLVETCHSIFDRGVNVLIDEVCRKKEQTTIEEIHREIAMHSQRHSEILRQRKDELCTRDNFNSLLFGDENPT